MAEDAAERLWVEGGAAVVAYCLRFCATIVAFIVLWMGLWVMGYHLGNSTWRHKAEEINSASSGCNR